MNLNTALFIRKSARFRIAIRFMSVLAFGCTACPSALAQSEQFWPAVNFYKSLNDYSRFYFQVQASRENREGEDIQVGPYIDFYLKPMRGLLDRNGAGADESRTRPLLFRIGYNYIPSTQNPTEQRIIVEVTPRFPLKQRLILTNRIRGEFRFIAGEFSTRFRDRLALERVFKVKRHALTPYLRVEFTYDTRYDKWNRTAFDAGAVFSIREHWELESYYEHQNDTSKAPNKQVEAIALELNLRF